MADMTYTRSIKNLIETTHLEILALNDQLSPLEMRDNENLFVVIKEESRGHQYGAVLAMDENGDFYSGVCHHVFKTGREANDALVAFVKKEDKGNKGLYRVCSLTSYNQSAFEMCEQLKRLLEMQIEFMERKP